MAARWGVGFGSVVLALLPALAGAPLAQRTRMVGVEVDRDGARVVGSSVKERPFVPRALPDEAPLVPGAPVQIEVALLGPEGRGVVVRHDVPGLCLAHSPLDEPHVVGDTIELHRESFVVEVPDLPGHDRVEIAYYAGGSGAAARRVLGIAPVEAAAPATSGAVIWPEQMGDPQVYSIYGDPAAVGERINVVIVPDGYTYAQKSVMQDHARALVDYFRAKTPYKEHDPFLNYILVYAYSVESGTDECDCGVIRDTAMASRFPNAGYPCGDSGNRCLYYGGGCDTSSTTNIVLSELRAPASDKTILMVNTPRYGGCGGARAVYSAANVVAVEIAGHELGHSLGSLADEYGGPGCGSFGNEVNTSTNPLIGAWPEWIDEIGLPRAGAQYYDSCVYRPEPSCEMRSLGPPFCRVCNQKWALTFFGHWRVAPTAPIRATAPPEGAVTADIGFPVPFEVVPRLASGPSVTNAITWRVGAAAVAAGVTAYAPVFPAEGLYAVSCEVIADTNFVKKEKHGANARTAFWSVDAISFPVPPEVSPPASPDALRFTTVEGMTWQGRAETGSSAFNLYRGTLAGLAGGDYGTCRASRLAANAFTETETPPPGVGWTFLVTGVTSSGEGTMGTASIGTPRVNAAPCE